MTGKAGLAAVFAAVSVGLGGCATCHHKAGDWSLCPSACPDTCVGQRNRVHVFLVGGVDLLDDGGLRGLRDAVNAAGFSQVYIGQVHHGGWFGREMRRIACDDPGARFVLVGYEVGAGNAVGLAADARRHGLCVDAVVLLDPVGVKAGGRAAVDAPVHVVGSDRWVPKDDLPGDEVIRLPNICHFAVAADPQTVALTTGLLRDAVGRVPHDSPPPLVMPMIDEPAPLPAVIPEQPVKSASADRRR